MNDTGRTPVVDRDKASGSKAVSRRHKRRQSPLLSCERLEDRVVLTFSVVSTSLLGSLSYVGVVTSPVVAATVPIPPTLPPVSSPPVASPLAPVSIAPGVIASWTQFRTDVQALQVELESLAKKSGATIADLQNLTNDSTAIASSGFRFGVRSLNSVISELAMAVAGGTSTSHAETDFTVLFDNFESFVGDDQRHVR